MTPHRRAVDHVLPIIGEAQFDQRFQDGIPHALLGPAPEADIDRVPFAIAFVHVTPRTAHPQHMEHSVQIAPIILRRSRLAAAF